MGLAATWLELPFCHFADFWESRQQAAGRADEHLLRRTQRLPPQMDALWGALESKILNSILDQASRALLRGWRFRALSPNLSLSADASNCKNSFHRDTDQNQNNCVRLGIFFCVYSFSVWKAHQYHQVGCSRFNNMEGNYQYLFKVKPWTAVPYNQ